MAYDSQKKAKPPPPKTTNLPFNADADRSSLWLKIAEVSRRIVIPLNGYNASSKYWYPTIDDYQASMHELLVQERLVMKAQTFSSTTTECIMETRNGDRQALRVEVKMNYTLINPDKPEEREEYQFEGSAIDMGDKAIFQAMSGAYKYWVNQTFSTGQEGADSEAKTITQGENGIPPTAEKRAGKIRVHIEHAVYNAGWPEDDGNGNVPKESIDQMAGAKHRILDKWNVGELDKIPESEYQKVVNFTMNDDFVPQYKKPTPPDDPPPAEDKKPPEPIAADPPTMSIEQEEDFRNFYRAQLNGITVGMEATLKGETLQAMVAYVMGEMRVGAISEIPQNEITLAKHFVTLYIQNFGKKK